MIRLSTTLIEAFRRFLEYEFTIEAELIAKVRGEPWKPSWQMKAGTEWDRLMNGEPALAIGEEIEDYCLLYMDNGFSFRADQTQTAIEHVGLGVCQVKNTIVVNSAFGPCTLVGVADHMQGLIVNENKAKFSTPDPKDYEASLQWRCYCLIFGAACVRYNLFHFRDPKGGYCELTDILSFRFWPYAGLEADCMMWLNEFLAWANDRHLLRYLHRESSTPQAA